MGYGRGEGGFLLEMRGVRLGGPECGVAFWGDRRCHNHWAMRLLVPLLEFNQHWTFVLEELGIRRRNKTNFVSL